MKKTKLLSSLLAISMLASMSLSSFAATPPSDQTGTEASTDLPTTGTTVNTTGTIETPAVKVKLPATADVLLNPYGLTINSKTDQIFAAGIKIENLTQADVAVYVKTVKGTPSGNLKLATKAPTATDTTNSAYLVLRTAVGTSAAAPTAADIKDIDTQAVVAASATKEGDVVIGTADLKSEVLVAKLKKSANGSTAENDGTCYSKIVGKMTTAPANPWTASDGVTIATTFTVKPTTIAGA